MRTALFEARKRRGESQEDVAAAVGIHRTHYLRIEAGTTAPSVAVAQRLKEHLGLTLDEVLTVHPREVAHARSAG